MIQNDDKPMSELLHNLETNKADSKLVICCINCVLSALLVSCLCLALCHCVFVYIAVHARYTNKTYQAHRRMNGSSFPRLPIHRFHFAGKFIYSNVLWHAARASTLATKNKKLACVCGSQIFATPLQSCEHLL